MRFLGFDITRSERETPADLLVAEQKRRHEERQLKPLSEQGWHSLVRETSAAGTRVSEEGAMALAAVFACVRVLSEGVSSLPFKLYRRDGRSRFPAPEHPLYQVLHDQGNDLMSAMELREVQMVHLLLWGNFYGEIQTDQRGNVVGIWPIHPARVTPRRVNQGDRVAVEYGVLMQGGQPRTLRQDQVLHLRGIGYDGLVGQSPIRMHMNTVGIALAAELYGARFYKNDTRSGLYLTTEQELSDEARHNIKKEFAGYEGADNAWKLKVLEAGLKIESVGLPPGEAHFLETRKYQRSEIASIYRVQPHLIGDLENATFSNIEHQAIEHVVHTLRPWLVRIEQATSMQLLQPEERSQYFAQHVVDGLLRGDIQARYQAYAVGRQWGFESANTILEKEDRNPIENGDIFLQPLNMVEAGTNPLEVGDEDVDFGDRGRRSIERRALPARYGTAKALETVYRDQLRRIVKREIVEIRKAVKALRETGDVAAFRDWVVAFEREHAEWMFDRVLPLFRTMAEAMVEASQDELGEEIDIEELATFITDYARAYTRRYTGASRGQLLALSGEDDDAHDDGDTETVAEAIDARLDEWDETRAQKEARRERQRSSNAFTKAAWAVVGVATLVWNSVGKSCRLCDEMDGRTAIISSGFLSAGDSVGDLQVTSNITHPPLHDGCDCILLPGGGARQRLTAAELRSVFAALLEDGTIHHHHHHTNGQVHEGKD